MVIVAVKFQGGPLNGQRRAVDREQAKEFELEAFDEGNWMVRKGKYVWVTGTQNPRVMIWMGWR